MIRTKGEAGTGDIVNAVTHMRSVFGAIRAAAGAARRRALRGSKGAPRAVRARALGRRERPAPGRHLHRRWDRDARRRLALHAARRGRRLRRLRASSSRAATRSSTARAGSRTSRAARARSSRRRRTSTTRRCSPTSRPVSASRWSASRRARSLSRSGSRSAAGDALLVGEASVARPLRIGVLALQGAFREHVRSLRRLGVDAVEVRLPEDLDGVDGLVIPGGESTTIMRLAALYGLDEAIRGFSGADLRNLRGNDRARPRPSRPRRAHGRPERVRPPGLELRGGRRPRRRRASAARRVHPCAAHARAGARRRDPRRAGRRARARA